MGSVLHLRTFLTFHRLEIVLVDSEVGEHLREQSLANFLLPVLDGCLAVGRVERSVPTRTFRHHEVVSGSGKSSKIGILRCPLK